MESPIELRGFQPADLGTLYEIDQACFPPGISYSRAELAAYVAGLQARTWIACQDREIVAFLIAEHDPDEACHIITVDVVKRWRRRGIANRLMQAAEDWARQRGAAEICLETAEDNLGAQEFYRARGYVKIDQVEAYYSNGTAAWVMTKQLKQGTRAQTGGKSHVD